MSNDKKDQRSPYIPVQIFQPGAISIGEARRISVAFALGDYRPDADLQKEITHRGMLPDVDFSQVVHVPRRSILARIRQAFARRSQDAIPEAEPASPTDDPLRAMRLLHNRNEKYRHRPASRAA